MRRPEPVGEVAQPIITSIISTARYLTGCFCTDRAPAQPGKSPLPPAPRRSLQQPGEMPGGHAATPTFGCWAGPTAFSSALPTHIVHLSLYRDHMGKGLCVYMEGWEEIKLERGQRSFKAPCCVPHSWVP